MKTLNLSPTQLQIFNGFSKEVVSEALYAVYSYCVLGEMVVDFKNETSSVLFKCLLPQLEIKIKKSKAGTNGLGTPKTNQKQNENKSKTKRKQNENKTKTQVTNLQQVTRTINKNVKKVDNKETEKKEEIEESSLSSPTPLSLPNLEDKEEKKDKEKKEIYVYKESENEELTDEEKEDEFFKLMKEHYPRVMTMKQPLTYKQYKKLIDEDGYSSRVIKDILEQMENYAPLNRSYVSANLTLRKWLKMRQNG